MGEVTPKPNPRFLRLTLPRLSLALHLGDGGPEEGAVSMDDGGTTVSKLNVFSTLDGGADLTTVSVESDTAA